MIKLINNDFKNAEVEKVDLILVDIPYNIGEKAYASNRSWWKNGVIKNGCSDKAESSFFETDKEFDLESCLLFIKEHLKENKKAVIFCGYEQQFEIIQLMKKYKFVKYTPLVFTKNSSAEVLKVNMRICGACEYGLILYNGKLGEYFNENKMILNHFEMKKSFKKLHPNEKPVDLLQIFIKLFTKENETVMDFCMGSGSTGVASILLNRNFIGIEIDEKYFNIAKERIINSNKEI